jgi:hypothetical protein
LTGVEAESPEKEGKFAIEYRFRPDQLNCVRLPPEEFYPDLVDAELRIDIDGVFPLLKDSFPVTEDGFRKDVPLPPFVSQLSADCRHLLFHHSLAAVGIPSSDCGLLFVSRGQQVGVGAIVGDEETLQAKTRLPVQKVLEEVGNLGQSVLETVVKNNPDINPAHGLWELLYSHNLLKHGEARQTEFFMTEEDEKEFLQFVKSTGKTEMLPFLMKSQSQRIKTLPRRESRPGWDVVFLTNRHAPGEILFKWIESRQFSLRMKKYHYPRSYDSPVIEFQRSQKTKGTLDRGRLWAEMTVADQQSLERFPKDARFREWYEQTSQWIKENYTPIGPYFAGKGAIEFEKKGGTLDQSEKYWKVERVFQPFPITLF